MTSTNQISNQISLTQFTLAAPRAERLSQKWLTSLLKESPILIIDIHNTPKPISRSYAPSYRRYSTRLGYSRVGFCSSNHVLADITVVAVGPIGVQILFRLQSRFCLAAYRCIQTKSLSRVAFSINKCICIWILRFQFQRCRFRLAGFPLCEKLPASLLISWAANSGYARSRQV